MKFLWSHPLGVFRHSARAMHDDIKMEGYQRVVSGKGVKLILQEGPVACKELSIVRIFGGQSKSNFSAIVKRSRKGGGKQGKETGKGKTFDQVKVHIHSSLLIWIGKAMRAPGYSISERIFGTFAQYQFLFSSILHRPVFSLTVSSSPSL